MKPKATKGHNPERGKKRYKKPVFKPAPIPIVSTRSGDTYPELASRTPPLPKCPAPHVLQPDLWWMLLSCVRYSMGRMSTAVGTTCGWVRQYLRYLTYDQIEQIKREIETELRSCNGRKVLLGMQCDHTEWTKLALDLGRYLTEIGNPTTHGRTQ